MCKAQLSYHRAAPCLARRSKSRDHTPFTEPMASAESVPAASAATSTLCDDPLPPSRSIARRRAGAVATCWQSATSVSASAVCLNPTRGTKALAIAAYRFVTKYIAPGLPWAATDQGEAEKSTGISAKMSEGKNSSAADSSNCFSAGFVLPTLGHLFQFEIVHGRFTSIGNARTIGITS